MKRNSHQTRSLFIFEYYSAKRARRCLCTARQYSAMIRLLPSPPSVLLLLLESLPLPLLLPLLLVLRNAPRRRLSLLLSFPTASPLISCAFLRFHNLLFVFVLPCEPESRAAGARARASECVVRGSLDVVIDIVVCSLKSRALTLTAAMRRLTMLII